MGDFPELKKEVEELASQKSVRFAYGALAHYYKKVNEKELLQKVRANWVPQSNSLHSFNLQACMKLQEIDIIRQKYWEFISKTV